MMRSMFKQPKAPKPQEMPKDTPTPTVDEAANRAEEDMRGRRRKGRNAYMLSKKGGRSFADVGASAVKTLTGQ